MSIETKRVDQLPEEKKHVKNAEKREQEGVNHSAKKKRKSRRRK